MREVEGRTLHRDDLEDRTSGENQVARKEGVRVRVWQSKHGELRERRIQNGRGPSNHLEVTATARCANGEGTHRSSMSHAPRLDH